MMIQKLLIKRKLQYTLTSTCRTRSEDELGVGDLYEHILTQGVLKVLGVEGCEQVGGLVAVEKGVNADRRHRLGRSEPLQHALGGGVVEVLGDGGVRGVGRGRGKRKSGGLRDDGDGLDRKS